MAEKDPSQTAAGFSDTSAPPEEYDGRAQFVFIAPYSPTLGRMKTFLEGDKNVAVTECGSPAEAQQVAADLRPCVLMASIQNQGDIVKLLNMLAAGKADFKSGKMKLMLTSNVKQPQIIAKFESFGVRDYILEPIQDRQFQFKVGLQIKANLAARKKTKVEADKRITADKSKTESAEVKLGNEKDSNVKDAPPQEIAEDMWVFKKAPQKKGNKYTFRLESADTEEGDWQKMPDAEDGQSQWRFMPKNGDKNAKAGWQYKGEEPSFDGQGWNFEGAKPELSFVDESGEKKASKVKTEADGTVTAAADSQVALEKLKKKREHEEKEKDRKKAALFSKTDGSPESKQDEKTRGEAEKAASSAKDDPKSPGKKSSEGKQKDGDDEDLFGMAMDLDGEEGKAASKNQEKSAKSEEEQADDDADRLGADGKNFLKKKRKRASDDEEDEVLNDDDGPLSGEGEGADTLGGRLKGKKGKKEGPSANPLADLDDFEGTQAKEKAGPQVSSDGESDAEGDGDDDADRLGSGSRNFAKRKKADDDDPVGESVDEIGGLLESEGKGADRLGGKLASKRAVSDEDLADGADSQLDEEGSSGEESQDGQSASSGKGKGKEPGKRKAVDDDDLLEAVQDENESEPGSRGARAQGKTKKNSSEDDDDDSEDSEENPDDSKDDQADALEEGSRNFFKKKKDEDDDPSEPEPGEAHSSILEERGGKGSKWGAKDQLEAGLVDDSADLLSVEKAKNGSLQVKEGEKEEVYEYPLDAFGQINGIWQQAGKENGNKYFVYCIPDLAERKIKDVTKLAPYWLALEDRPSISSKSKMWMFKGQRPRSVDAFGALPAIVRIFLLGLSADPNQRLEAAALAEEERKKKQKELAEALAEEKRKAKQEQEELEAAREEKKAGSSDLLSDLESASSEGGEPSGSSAESEGDPRQDSSKRKGSGENSSEGDKDDPTSEDEATGSRSDSSLGSESGPGDGKKGRRDSDGDGLWSDDEESSGSEDLEGIDEGSTDWQARKRRRDSAADGDAHQAGGSEEEARGRTPSLDETTEDGDFRKEDRGTDDRSSKNASDGSLEGDDRGDGSTGQITDDLNDAEAQSEKVRERLEEQKQREKEAGVSARQRPNALVPLLRLSDACVNPEIDKAKLFEYFMKAVQDSLPGVGLAVWRLENSGGKQVLLSSAEVPDVADLEEKLKSSGTAQKDARHGGVVLVSIQQSHDERAKIGAVLLAWGLGESPDELTYSLRYFNVISKALVMPLGALPEVKVAA